MLACIAIPAALRLALRLCCTLGTVALAGQAPAAPQPRLVVDRIEGEVAVVEVAGEHFVDVPVALLPEGAGEGSRLRLVLEP